MLYFWTFGFVRAEIEDFSTLPNCVVPQDTLKEMLDNMLNKSYDARIRPYFGERKPVNVGINIFVAGMDEISEIDMDYTLTVYFLQKWNDPRLKLDPNNEYGPPGWLDSCSVSLSSIIENDIWTPDVYFINEKFSFKHTVTMMNAMFRLLPQGDVLYSIRITMKLSCQMDLSSYPLDEQVCSLKIESYSHDETEMFIYMMETDPNKTNDAVNGILDLSLQQFEIQQARIENKLHTENGFTNQRITLNFWLRRRITYFLLQSYVPCTLITILSWVSFWINYEATAARVSLGITTVMTMTTIYTHVSSGMPKIPDLKALDVFMLACFVFVFMALLEYAIVNYSFFGRRRLKSKNKEKEKKEEHLEQRRTSRQINGRIGNTSRPSMTIKRPFTVRSPGLRYRNSSLRNAPKPAKLGATFKAKTRKIKLSNFSVLKIKDVSVIDEISRRVFPCSFIIFNIVYWTYYKFYARKNLN